MKKFVAGEYLRISCLIAEFMGGRLERYDISLREVYRFKSGGFKTRILPEKLQYLYSWDALMPVVQKINTIVPLQFTIYPHTAHIHANGVINNWQDITVLDIDPRTAVFKAVGEFLKWNRDNGNKIK